MEPIHKWRVVIIMAHDGETYFEYNDLEQSILDQAAFDNLSYVIFYYNQKYNRISIKEVRIEIERRYLRELPVTEEFCGKDFYEPQTLIDFLQFVKGMENQGHKEGEQEIQYHYFVITWGHGGGLFYFPSGKIEDLLKDKGLLPTENILIEPIINKFRANLLVFSQMCSDASYKVSHGVHEKPFPFLTVDMFQDGEQYATEKKDKQELFTILEHINKTVARNVKFYTASELNIIFRDGLNSIDLFFALNCYTQMLETGYELRQTVKMMVAPQTTIPLPGINYSEIFAKLEQTPEISLSVLSQTIRDSYDRKYTPAFRDVVLSHYPMFPFPVVSYSCNFLDKYQLLLDSLNQLTALIRKIYTTPELEPNIRDVSVARRRCGDLTPDNNYGIIDLNNFLIELQNRLPESFNKEITAIRTQTECVRDYVRAAIKIPDAVPAASGAPSDNPLFLSFFAPAFVKDKFIDYLIDMYRHSENEYTLNSEWDNFVKDFYNNTIFS